MNTWQALRQIKARLAAATWPDSPGEPVFGSVVASAGFGRNTERSAIRFPLVRLWPGSLTTDDEESDLAEEGLQVELTQSVEGDHTGEVALLGGTRSAAGQGGSGGRGLLEIQEVLCRELGQIGRDEGFDLSLVQAGGSVASEDDVFGYLATRTYEFTGWVTGARSYPAARKLRAADAGGQTADLTWVVPSDRFDRHSLILRRATGGTPPAGPTDGVDVPLAGFPSSHSDPVGTAGTFSYSLFVGYDEIEAGAPDRYSKAATVTVALA